MIKQIIRNCVIIGLTLAYIFGVAYVQDVDGAALGDLMTYLVLGLWMYIILMDWDLVLTERRALRLKHVIYEGLFLASLGFITGAFVADTFGWALAWLILSIAFFIAGTVMYVYCFKQEDKFISSELENARHLLWVLTELKAKTEYWTEERIVEYATKKFRFYPKGNHLERGLDVFSAVDTTGTFRTLEEMKAVNPAAPEVIIAENNIRAIAADYVTRRTAKENKKAQKKAQKEAK